MTKKITLNEIVSIYGEMNKYWDEEIKSVSLSTRALYNLISLKRKLEDKVIEIQQTANAIMIKNGGEVKDDGLLKVPSENVEQTNKELLDLSSQEIDFEFNEIILGESDEISPIFMEILYDFIILK